MNVHDEMIVIPRRPRRTDAEIVVKIPVVSQVLDNYNSGSVTFAPPVMIAPTLAELPQQDQFAGQVSVCQTSYEVCTSLPTQKSTVVMSDQTTRQDVLSLDWLNYQLDSSPSPSPISTSVSTPSDSTPSNHPDWFMGALSLSKTPLLAPSDPLNALYYFGEWDAFTFGI